jgi:hypothetical protein
MTTEKFKQNAHLYLGITRAEFARRVAAGLINFELLKSQIEQNSLEIGLDSKCEGLPSAQSADQVDKFDYLEESAL